jgi:hypothetical protein
MNAGLINYTRSARCRAKHVARRRVRLSNRMRRSAASAAGLGQGGHRDHFKSQEQNDQSGLAFRGLRARGPARALPWRVPTLPQSCCRCVLFQTTPTIEQLREALLILVRLLPFRGGGF